MRDLIKLSSRIGQLQYDMVLQGGQSIPVYTRNQRVHRCSKMIVKRSLTGLTQHRIVLLPF